jgi:hypothetical protein
VADRRQEPHNVAALILSGLVLAAFAVGLSATWIADGDGTCGALYKPNLARRGCSGKLLPAGVTSAALAGAAILAGDAARRAARRPSRAASVAVGIGVVAVLALFTLLIGLGRHGDPEGGRPSPPATSAPATAPNW